MDNIRIDFDIELLKKSQKKFIIGIDEVGWGCIAGDLVLGGSLISLDFYQNYNSILQQNPLLEKIRDSKKISEKIRMKIYEEFKNSTLFSVTTGQCSVDFINQFGLAKAYTECINQILSTFKKNIADSLILIDGTRDPKTSMISDYMLFEKGDDKSFAMGIASTIAKVHRDLYMKELDLKFPQYGFIKNNGYGSLFHAKALKTNGLSPIHRIGASTKIINGSYGKE